MLGELGFAVRVPLPPPVWNELVVYVTVIEPLMPACAPAPVRLIMAVCVPMLRLPALWPTIGVSVVGVVVVVESAHEGTLTTHSHAGSPLLYVVAAVK